MEGQGETTRGVLPRRARKKPRGEDHHGERHRAHILPVDQNAAFAWLEVVKPVEETQDTRSELADERDTSLCKCTGKLWGVKAG
jgi:hypothetical protein